MQVSIRGNNRKYREISNLLRIRSWQNEKVTIFLMSIAGVILLIVSDGVPGGGLVEIDKNEFEEILNEHGDEFVFIQKA